MFLRSFLVFVLAAALPGFGQSAVEAGAGLPNDPRAIFEAAAPFYDFYSPELKPWHLKATYQLYDDKGNPSEQGTYEFWWASPKVYRSTWTRPGVGVSEWHTAAGTSMRKASESPLRYFERTMNSILLFPLPSRSPLDAGRLKLELEMVAVGSEKLACVSSSPQREPNSKVSAPSSAVLNYDCFDPSTHALLMSYSNSVTKEFGQIVKIQGRYLPRSVVISAGKQKIFTVSVEAIEGMKPDDAALIPPADAVLVHHTDNQQSVHPNNEVTAGNLIKKTQPVYPHMAKTEHIQGIVVIAAVIGTDGRIRNLEVLASPSPLLTESATDAVKRWEYKPYLLNGTAVEVESIINVTYSLGQ